MNDSSRHNLDLLHQSLLSGTLLRNLSWLNVLELVKHLGKVDPYGSDEFAFTVAGHRGFFKRPHGHDLSVEEVSHLRGYLRASGPSRRVATPVQPVCPIVSIDHSALFKNSDATEQTGEGERGSGSLDIRRARD